MEHTDRTEQADALLDQAVTEGGAYAVIRKRLEGQGRALFAKADALNQQRVSEFGATELAILGRVRSRTEHNCIGRDIVRVGDYLLFGYNVFIGLKTETAVGDVFALYRWQREADELRLEPAPLARTFLDHPSFKQDFLELYTYYKHTRLIQLVVKDGTLLAAFQISERAADIRVFRWRVSTDGQQIQYVDNRGERDIALPQPFDFQWVVAGRNDAVQGRFAHLNILDQVFVETTGGDLTLKVEDNTETGLGIYSEPVEDQNQSLDDAKVQYAQIGPLILIKVLPYREKQWRTLIFNSLLNTVERIDAIGDACRQLPEGHGLIYPGGLYLASGERRDFGRDFSGMRFKRAVRSPNAEDVLFLFYQPDQGRSALLSYNLVDKTLHNPIVGHGYALLEDGHMVIFSAEGDEPTRVHPMQLWQTPYCSQAFASAQPPSTTFIGRIGNAELVRGVSDLLSLCKEIDRRAVSLRLYHELVNSIGRLFDRYHWLSAPEALDIGADLQAIGATAELVIDEFEKVQSIRESSARAMAEAEQAQRSLLSGLRPDAWDTLDQFIQALAQLRAQRGRLATVRDYRYIDTARIDALDDALVAAARGVEQHTADFLLGDQALAPYQIRLQAAQQAIDEAQTTPPLDAPIAALAQVATELDTLSELLGTIEIADPSQQAAIIEGVSAIYGRLNQGQAVAQRKRSELGADEARAQFAARFALFSQSITNALALADTPAKCDQQMGRLIVQLEELESSFADYDEFLGEILGKREALYESFEAHKQALMDERQRRALALFEAAGRVLDSIARRVQRLSDLDALHSFYATDPLILKVRDLVGQLRALEDPVKADDLEARFIAARDNAQKVIRDKAELYLDGGRSIRLGPTYRFSVNTQELDLTILARDGRLCYHLTGTEFYEPIDDQELLALSHLWSVDAESESAALCRAEYLAGLFLEQLAERQRAGEDIGALVADRDALAKVLREFAAPRYREGYQKGIHDHDAALLVASLQPALARADLLRYTPTARAVAVLFWAHSQRFDAHRLWPLRARSALAQRRTLNSDSASQLLVHEVVTALGEFLGQHPLPLPAGQAQGCAEYLVAELAREPIAWLTSQYARQLVALLGDHMQAGGAWACYRQALDDLAERELARWQLSDSWLQALIDQGGHATLAPFVPEAIALLNAEGVVARRDTQADVQVEVNGLLGSHARIAGQSLTLEVDDFLARYQQHRSQFVPAYRRYLALRQRAIGRAKARYRLDEFKPKPLSAFVRNKLINDVYLPLIGANLAKQMGTVGENKRTDLMGLLMMISPPGYGKTTLMEYVASRLGLIFMKINCPALGHQVLSLDPEQAPNATARQELLKLNMALEMGGNTMLYLDDIQHTHPEFLQKFISLCDGTRRIEGVWGGRTKTYDMRGKKFCVIMAGNPYTESGEVFKVPDMLANRADIYNLGEVLGGMEAQFGLSYIENSLTSHPLLAPLATRDLDDVYRFVDRALGKDISTSDFSHAYSAAEADEVLALVKRMLVIRDLILRVNRQYIRSAAQADSYRTEPPFKLQGSYRNMNKMVEKLSPVMDDAELQQLIGDHYLGEAQLLTSGAEENLLKLAELRGTLSTQARARWEQLKAEFVRQLSLGGADAGVGDQVVLQLHDLASQLGAIEQALQHQGEHDPQQNIRQLIESLGELGPLVSVTNQPIPGLEKVIAVLADTMVHTIFPLINNLQSNFDADQQGRDHMQKIAVRLRRLESELWQEEV